MDVTQGLVDSLPHVKFLGECARYFSNWMEIWAAHWQGTSLPTLVPRSRNKSIRVQHTAEDDPILLFKEILVGRCYTPTWFYQPTDRDTVIDLGANIGVFMLHLISQSPKIQVHCFEPSSKTHQCLESQIAANSLGNNIHIYPHAVSDRAGTATLKLAKNSGHQSFFDSEFVDAEEETVATLSLQNVLERCAVSEVDLLKIDVEGAEIEIVEGASIETWQRIRRVVCEYHDVLRPGCRQRVADCLTANGFQVHISPPEGVLGLIYAKRF